MKKRRRGEEEKRESELMRETERGMREKGEEKKEGKKKAVGSCDLLKNMLKLRLNLLSNAQKLLLSRATEYQP